MFSEKKSVPGQVLARNIIGKNTTFVGNITSEGDFRIDGKVEGNIKTSGKVIVGQEGMIEGIVECSNADIEGKVLGSLIVDQLLLLKSSAHISGDVVLDKISVEPGAVFNASCTMKGSVKAQKNEKKKAGKTA